MGAKQIKELQKLGVNEIPPDMYPEGWLEWANDQSKRVNLNRASVCVDAKHGNGWGRPCLFIASGSEYRDRGYHHRNEYQKHRINGRPVRVYIGGDTGGDTGPIPF